MRYPLTSFSFFPKTYNFKIILSTQVVKTDLRLWGLHKLWNRWVNRKYNFCNDRYRTSGWEVSLHQGTCYSSEHSAWTTSTLGHSLTFCCPRNSQVASDAFLLISTSSCPRTSSLPPHSHPQQLWPYFPLLEREASQRSSCKLAPILICAHPVDTPRTLDPLPGKCNLPPMHYRSQPFLPLLGHSSSCSPQSCATSIFLLILNMATQKTTCSLALILGKKTSLPSYVHVFSFPL